MIVSPGAGYMVMRRHRYAPTCPHCGKVIPSSEVSGWDIVGILGVSLLIAMLLIWACLTAINWMDPALGGNRTLVQILIDQWHWLVDLMHRIY